MPRNVAIGLGLMEFPFSGVGGFWRWVDLCEAGGVDSLWQTDRVVSRAFKAREAARARRCFIHVPRGFARCVGIAFHGSSGHGCRG